MGITKYHLASFIIVIAIISAIVIIAKADRSVVKQKEYWLLALSKEQLTEKKDVVTKLLASLEHFGHSPYEGVVYKKMVNLFNQDVIRLIKEGFVECELIKNKDKGYRLTNKGVHELSKLCSQFTYQPEG